MSFDYRRMFMGSKFAIFNYATRETGGYIDVLDFEYRVEGVEENKSGRSGATQSNKPRIF